MAMVTMAYLVTYNACCLAGWSMALWRAVAAIAEPSWGAFGGVWKASGSIVLMFQFAMCLEILHAVLGLVRSPVFTTWLQVFSRLWTVVLPVVGDACLAEQSMPGLMLVSWASVEVIRYSFYLSALVLPKVPYPIFWLRYTAFAILYPTGITGELGTAFGALGCGVSPLIKIIMVFYIPGAPFMYMNMVGNRKSAFKKRFAPPPKPARGCSFPVDGKGARSTTEINKKAIAAALEGAGATAAAEQCLGEKKYRFKYVKHVLSLVDACAASKEKCLAASKAGLDYMRRTMEFIDANNVAVPFGDAVKPDAPSSRTLETVEVAGKGAAATQYSVPYDGGWHPSTPKPPGKNVEGTAGLQRLCGSWIAKGVVEKDACDAIMWTAHYVEKQGSLKNCYFVLIGAGSAMGPCLKLLELGANVIAVDIPGSWGRASKMWERLIAAARNSAGTLTIPVKSASCSDDELTTQAGCDLLNEPKEIADWLCGLVAKLPSTAKVCIGNYTYLDGELHVKLSLCADSLIDRVLSDCKKRDLSSTCAFLCTPTDAHLVPEAVAADSVARYKARSVFSKLVQAVAPKTLKPNYKPGARVCDGLSVAQGPNYALAKRMQHWRACLANANGHAVSSMVAPSTATISVIHNRTFAWAYGGMPVFGFEIFKQETTTAVMAAILVHDVLNPKGPKQPSKDRNPLELFASEAVHGGLWRSPFAVDSIGEVSALRYFGGIVAPFGLYLVVAAAAAVATKFTIALTDF